VHVADIINAAAARAAAEVAEHFAKLHAGTLPFAQPSLLPCCILMTRLVHNAVWRKEVCCCASSSTGLMTYCWSISWLADCSASYQYTLCGRIFLLTPLRPRFAGGQQQLFDEVRSWNSSRTVEASKLSLSDLLVLRRLLRMYVVPEGAEVSAVLDPSACDSDFEW